LCLNRTESLVDEDNRNFVALSQVARPVSSGVGSLALDTIESDRKPHDDLHRIEFLRNVRNARNRSITRKHSL
jgi:hypothetical protein